MKTLRRLLLPLALMVLALVVTASVPGASQAQTRSDYKKVTDIHDALTMQVPMDWDETETDHWVVQNKEVGVYIAASPDLYAFLNGSDTPGVFFGASRQLAGSQRVNNPALQINPAIPRLLNGEKNQHLKKCKDGGRFDYVDQFYKGQYDRFEFCSDGPGRTLVLVAMPAHQEVLVYLMIKTVNVADDAAVKQILNSFQVMNNTLEDSHGDH